MYRPTGIVQCCSRGDCIMFILSISIPSTSILISFTFLSHPHQYLNSLHFNPIHINTYILSISIPSTSLHYYLHFYPIHINSYIFYVSIPSTSILIFSPFLSHPYQYLYPPFLFHPHQYLNPPFLPLHMLMLTIFRLSSKHLRICAF